ncbi:hypothetical protein C0Q70_05691 [Pomacea canaliculata]|uniref:Secreted protein n=1 Tax=Pomacea canaliculata TaxID=400727 RepID=A0A2T7PLW7_POMCA|nr:hypothetical protein C0Q70_05691 [Pomacea canaliculata]
MKDLRLVCLAHFFPMALTPSPGCLVAWFSQPPPRLCDACLPATGHEPVVVTVSKINRSCVAGQVILHEGEGSWPISCSTEGTYRRNTKRRMSGNRDEHVQQRLREPVMGSNSMSAREACLRCMLKRKDVQALASALPHCDAHTYACDDRQPRATTLHLLR